jgi:hypothetical protein
MKLPFITSLFLIIIMSCNSGNESVDRSVSDTAQSVTFRADSSGNSKNSSQGSEASDKAGSDNGDNAPGNATSLTWTKLHAGSQSKMDKRSMFVINNKTKFDELWSIAFQQGMAPGKPNIDFSKNSVLVLFLGQVNSGGHSIEPLSIRSLGNDPGYIVTVRHNKPGTNCVTTSAIEYPYYFALTDKIKSEKQEFKVSEGERKCE